MNALAIGAVIVLITLTLAIGLNGIQFARSTSDFLTARREPSQLSVAAGISGSFISAASVMGIAALVMTFGIDMLWYPIGFTAGYLMILVLIAAPLRRSGAFTLPDFAELRMSSRTLRRIASVFTVIIGWLCLVPQMKAAALAITYLTGATELAGPLVVAIVAGVTIAAGGYNSIATVQSVQYWLKLFAVALSALVIWWVWIGKGSPTLGDRGWVEPLSGFADRAHPAYFSLAIVIATVFGVMGLPDTFTRYYSIKDGTEARRTSFIVLVMLSGFYIFPPMLGALGRHFTPELIGDPQMDTVVLALPQAALPGVAGDVIGALVAVGVVAAILSSTSGVTFAISSTLTQDLLRRRLRGVAGFRVGVLITISVPFAFAFAARDYNLADMIVMAMAVGASTFAPVLMLGIWWRGLSVPGAISGMLTGGISSTSAVLLALFVDLPEAIAPYIAAPAVVTVPLAFAITIGVSLATHDRRPGNASALLGRLHTPERFRR